MSKETTSEEAKKTVKEIIINMGDSRIDYYDKQAIEVVLQELERLKQKEIHWNKLEKTAEGITFDDIEKVAKDFDRNYISKDVIKEKIEELNCRMAKYKEYFAQGKETDTEYYENIADIQTKRILEEILQESR